VDISTGRLFTDLGDLSDEKALLTRIIATLTHIIAQKDAKARFLERNLPDVV